MKAGLFATLGATLLTIMALGCSSDVPMGTVKGVVTYQGQELTAGTVTFSHVKGPTYSAAIQPNGQYRASVMVGENKISIDPTPVIKGNADPSKGVEAPPPMAIPDMYKDAQKSGLSLTVKAGVQTHNLELQ